ncbi:hypothetical protein SDC9_132787 [bioreactor metagenome]|uniref:Uncharacterized protein n=1 Tax=bioreactor metagenome TaxID=1076179 RepID=A0A645D8J2_9ZZZZ
MAQGFDQQLADDGQVADVHDPDVDAFEGEMRFPENEADGEQNGQRQRQAGGQRAGQEGFENQEQAEQLDRHVEFGLAQDLDLEGCLHESRQGAFEHDQEGHAEQRDGHAVASRKVVAVEYQVFGYQEGRQHDHEECVVAVAVLAAIADQRPHQHGGDAAKKGVVGEHGDRQRPLAAEAHGQPLDDPGSSEQHQGRSVIAADVDPVLGRGEQEAPQYRPAEAEEHLMGMPLNRCERRVRGRQAAAEHQRPGDGEEHAGKAGEGEEGAEADEPQRVGA